MMGAHISKHGFRWTMASLLLLFVALQGCTFGAYGTHPEPQAKEVQENKAADENPDIASNPTLAVAQQYAPIFINAKNHLIIG